MKKWFLLSAVLLLSGCICFYHGNPTIIGQVDYALPEIHTNNVPSISTKSRVHTQTIRRSQLQATEILVKPYLYDEQTANQLQQELKTVYYRLYPNINTIVLGAPLGTDIDNFLAAAREHPLIETAEINYPIVTMSTPVYPNDPKYIEGNQWNIDAIYLPYAWNITTGSKDIKIAVLDTGIDQNHEDLNANLNSDYDDPELIKTDDHGTHVAGIIGADTNNNQGIAGINWDVELISIPIFPIPDSGSLSDLVSGIKTAIELEVDIINISAGIKIDEGTKLPSLEAAIQATFDAGIIVVAAAGNEGVLLYPAAYPQVIAVGATNIYHDISSYSTSDDVEIFAPGGDSNRGIVSTGWERNYQEKSGTSMAAPHVSGLIGLIQANNPGLSPNEIEDLLWTTGIVINPAKPDQRLINAYAVLTETSLSDAEILLIDMENSQNVHQINIHETQRSFSKKVEPGSYLLTFHLDVDGNQQFNQGDWYYEDRVVITRGERTIDLGMFRLQLQVE